MFRLTSTSRVASHRFAFALAHPETEIEGMHVHHRCENRLCCNPAHLELLDPIEHAKRHADQRECPHGHAYDEANTILRPRSGGRVQRACRACRAWSSRRYRQNKKVSAPGGRTDRASLIQCPDCTETFPGPVSALTHAKDAHSSEHPGMEPSAVAVSFEIHWEPEDYDLGIDFEDEE